MPKIELLTLNYLGIFGRNKLYQFAHLSTTFISDSDFAVMIERICIANLLEVIVYAVLQSVMRIVLIVDGY